jgi:hypothetical protein
MSDVAKKARAAMKERAQRRAEPAKGDIDASGWREPTINSTQKTGMRPISKRAFKRGGKVNLKAEGSEGMKHAGRKPRASGGMTVDDYINRDQKVANEKRGYAHVGGYKKGGKAKHDDAAMDKKLIKTMVSKKALKKADGGQTVNRAGKGDYAGSYPADLSNEELAKIRAGEAERAKKEQEWQNTTAVGKKRGGKVHDKGCTCKACGGRTERKAGGRTGKANGGKFGIASPFKGKGGDMLDMGAQFLSPAYALARGKPPGLLGMMSGMMGKKSGGATKGNYDGGTRPTGGRIARKAGGKVKGKTNIHININTAPKPDAMGMPMPLPPMPLKPPPGLPPAAAMGAPGMMPPAGGPPMPPAGGMPMGLPPGAPPMMGRKAGGRVHRSYKDMDAGAGGGLGRLEKTEIQKNKR